MSKFKEYKIRTYGNKNLSKAIQDCFFKMGYAWVTSQCLYDYVKAPYLFAYGSGKIAWDDHEMGFRDSGHKELTVDELFKLANEVEKRKEMTVQEIEEALEMEPGTLRIKK